MRRCASCVVGRVGIREDTEPPARVAELARGQHVDDGGLHGNRHHLAAADLLPRFALRISPVGEEIRGASFVDDIEERTAGDQNDHDDDVRLHDHWRYERRQVCKRIYCCEHQ